MLRNILILFVLLCPALGNAQVMISEVAWMGTTVDANNEWIELYNHGTEGADVVGWTLTDGVSLSIPLQGTIPARSLAILERTDDSTLPDISAFLIYTGALSNDGRTLTLRNAAGEMMDQAVGGEGWSGIGGNNETKETAQRAMTGWVTGTPTPNAPNVEHDSTAANTDTTNTDTQVQESNSTTKSSGGGSSSKKTAAASVVSEPAVLSLTMEAPKTAYVNQRVSFSVEPKGLGNAFMNSLGYVWSFGDTYAATGTKVTHTFKYPGKYVVVVQGSFAKQSATTRHEVTVLPITFSLSRTEHGDLEIKNLATYEINLSGFVLKGGTDLTMPEHTIVLPGGSLIVDADRLEEGTQKMVALYDTRGAMVASDIPQLAFTPAPKEVVLPSVKFVPLLKNQVVVDEAPSAVFSKDTSIVASGTVTRIQETIIPIGRAQAASVISSEESTESSGKLPYIGLVLVVLIGILLLYVRRLPSVHNGV